MSFYYFLQRRWNPQELIDYDFEAVCLVQLHYNSVRFIYLLQYKLSYGDVQVISQRVYNWDMSRERISKFCVFYLPPPPPPPVSGAAGSKMSKSSKWQVYR